MAAITFPASPALDDIHSVGTRSWKFNGTAWKLVPKTTTDIEEGTNLYYTDDRVALAPAVTALEGRATSLEGRLGTAEGDIETLQNDLASVQGTVSGIGSAFSYRGTVAGASEESALDLSAVTNTSLGSYYKVSTTGYVFHPARNGGQPFLVNQGDGIVFNNSGTVDIIDNTNSTVAGTADEITVTGSTDTGYTVSLDPAFAQRFTNVEADVSMMFGSQIPALNGEVQRLDLRIDDERERINAHDQQLATLELQTVPELEGDIETLQSDMTSVQGTISNLGTMSTQNADSVAITGGTISGVTLVASALEVGSANQTADLFVSESGNVGIGTETPSERLSVAGNITATGTISAADPTESTHLATKAYVDAADSVLRGEIGAVETDLQTEITRATTAEQTLSDSIVSLTTGLASSVLDTVLTGLSTATNAAISATDSVLVAFGKLQAQVSAVLSSLNTHVADTNNPHAVTKAQVGLDAADNTSDADKPVSTAQASAIAARQIADTLGTAAPAHEDGRRWIDTTDMSEYVSFNGAWIELDRA